MPTTLFFAAVIAGSIGYGIMTQDDRPKPVIASSMETNGEKKAQETLPEATFVNAENKPVRIADFRDQVVLVNLWATWCTPCVAELPSLDRLQAKMRDKPFKVVAISMDRDDPAKVKAFLDAREADNIEFFWDRDRDVASKWSYAGIPTTYLVGRDGHVIARWDGPQEWLKGTPMRKIKAALAD